MSTELQDDLGTPVELLAAPLRLVSLVPSLTEAIAATRRDLLVGATDWCSQPPDLDVVRVSGTKNPDLAAIQTLTPDLVITNREENRQPDVQRLRAAGVPVWVTSFDALDEAFASLHRLFEEVLQLGTPDWLTQAQRVWAPAPTLELDAALPIWRDPWMVVAGGTFSNDLLARVGVRNVFAGLDRYPQVTLTEIQNRAPLVILPDEPYAFGPDDGPECFTRSVLIDGRATAWYGPSLVWARHHLEKRLAPCSH